ncbi:hypothetical protein [Pedobacter aquatilis]|uniref:hypothetical protein n=1 Tax=Pedobacter aquatilis TaxID=351343 RepID=UPI00292FE0AD|nr:hypothetical protein [Pedobacter aquatilis]
MANETHIEALTTIISLLKDMEVEAQKRTLQAVATFLDIPLKMSDHVVSSNVYETTNSPTKEISFSENRSISPKEFVRDKSPKTDIERIVCLAYYLTHYRDVAHFKTVDLSTLNTEAAQPKLSNPTVAVDNATKSGMLVQAVRGSKQISAMGETFVRALPDREAAKASIAGMKTRRKTRKPAIKSSTTKTNASQ